MWSYLALCISTHSPYLCVITSLHMHACVQNPISDTHQLFDQLAHQEGSSTISLGQLSLYLPCQHPESAAKWLAETVWSTLKSFPHVSFAALLCDLMTPAPDTCVSALAASRGQTVRNGELNLGVLPSGTMGKWKPGLIVFESACEALNFTGTTFKGTNYGGRCA